MLYKSKLMFGKMPLNQQLKLESNHNMVYDDEYLKFIKLNITRSNKFLLKCYSILFKHSHLIKPIGNLFLIMRIHDHHRP